MQVISAAGSTNSKIMIVGECPDLEELKKGSIFSSYTYTELPKVLMEAGISIQTCYRTHLIKHSIPGNDASVLMAIKKKERTTEHITYNGREVLPSLIKAIESFKLEIEKVKPNVIVAMGNVAMWALTGNWSVHSWRSSILPLMLETNLDYVPKVIPVYAISTINKMWEWRYIHVQDFRRVKKESEFREIRGRQFNFIINPSYTHAYKYLQYILDQLEVSGTPIEIGVDIETKFSSVECIALALSEVHAICIPFIHTDGRVFWKEEEEIELVILLSKILQHRNIHAIGQGYMYDYYFLYERLLISTRLYRDTMINQHCIFSNGRKDLSFLSSIYLDDHAHWKEEGKVVDDITHWNYNCKDACNTLLINKYQQETINAMGLTEVAKFQNSMFKYVMNMTRKGTNWDREKADNFDRLLIDLMQEREKWIEEVLGYLPNIDSSVQMNDLFYRQLNQKKNFNRKTMSVSCDDEALTKIAEREPLLEGITTRIQEIRTIGKLLEVTRARLTADKRITTAYNIAGTKTYRFNSAKNPLDIGANLQNITDGKRSTIELPNLRELLIPDKGYTYFDVDLDSADLRIVAAEADLEEMFAMLNEGKKVYVEVMKEYFKDPTMTKHHKMYTTFKALCHGTHYLGTVKGLASQTGLLIDEVDRVQSWYYGKFPKLKKWQDSIKDQVFKRKMVSNVFGYRYYIFNRIEGTILNEVIAWIPQSTVACLINRALVTLGEKYEYSEDLHVLQQTHDSLSGQLLTSKRGELEKEILKATEIPLKYPTREIIIPSELHLSELSWGNCK